MRTLRVLAFVVIGLFLASSLTACSDLIEDTLGIGSESAAALAEDDLPNCSRVSNCCDRLSQSPYSAVVPSSVHSTCSDTLGTAADMVISEYQSEQSLITNQSGLTDENETQLLSDLQEQWSSRVEPGCRCFLEETVGTLPDLTMPADCESFTTTGALEGGETCSDGIDAVLDAATNGVD